MPAMQRLIGSDTVPYSDWEKQQLSQFVGSNSAPSTEVSNQPAWFQQLYPSSQTSEVSSPAATGFSDASQRLQGAGLGYQDIGFDPKSVLSTLRSQSQRYGGNFYAPDASGNMVVPRFAYDNPAKIGGILNVGGSDAQDIAGIGNLALMALGSGYANSGGGGGDIATSDIGVGTGGMGTAGGAAPAASGAATTVDYPQPFSQPDATPTIDQSTMMAGGQPFTLGMPGAGALGLPGPTGQTPMPFQTQPAPAAAPAQPGQTNAPATPATPPSGAPTAPSSTSAPTSGQGGSMVDKILSQMKNNPLGTAGLAMSALPLLASKSGVPQATQQQSELGANAKATSDQLLNQYRSGQLSAAQQSSLDQLTQQTKAQLAQYFASIGQSDSTAARQAMAQVDQQALGMKQQMLDNALQQGLNAIGVAGGQLGQVAQTQIGQDRALTQAFGNFASQLGNFAGQKAATPPPATASTVAPTVQSNQ